MDKSKKVLKKDDEDDEMTSYKRILFNLAFVLLGMLMIAMVFTAINYVIFVLGDDIKTLNYAYNIENHLNEINATMPFPDSGFDINRAEFDYYSDIREYYFTMDFKDFQEIVKLKYEYSDTYDCKYWTYMWTTYWKYNKDRYDWKIKYIDTDNHVLAMVYNSSSYCMLDQENVDCSTLI